MLLEGDETIMQKVSATCNTFLIDNNFDWERLVDFKGVCNIQKMNGNEFVGKLKKALNKKNEFLKTKSSYISINQPICIIDCRKIKDGDALLFLEKLSQISKVLRPVVVIQNITEISSDISNKKEIYRLLIHLWEKKKCRLKNTNGKIFTIHPVNYVVYRTWEYEDWDSLAKIWGIQN